MARDLYFSGLDKRGGTGSAVNPYHGTSAALIDARLRPLFVAGEPDVRITFAPGATFETFGFGDAVFNSSKGTYGWGIAGDNWTVNARGATIKLVRNAEKPAIANRWIVAPDQNHADCCINGGTWDCDYLTIKDDEESVQATSGIMVAGHGCRIEACHVINHGAIGVDYGFATLYSGTHIDIADGVISNVRVSQCHGIGPIGIGLWGNHLHDPLARSAISVRECDVELPEGYGHGVNFFGQIGTRFERNTFRLGSMGIYCDTGPDNEIFAQANTFLNCGAGIYLTGGYENQYDTCRIENNAFTIPQGGFGIYINPLHARRNVVTGNTLRLASGASSGTGIYFVPVTSGSGNIVDRNVVDAGLTNTLDPNP